MEHKFIYLDRDGRQQQSTKYAGNIQEALEKFEAHHGKNVQIIDITRGGISILYQLS